MSRSSEIAATAAMVSRWALRELRKESKNTCHPAAIRLQPLPKVSPEETQDVKTQDTWPQIAEVPTKGMISLSPDSYIFPYIEKC